MAGAESSGASPSGDGVAGEAAPDVPDVDTRAEDGKVPEHVDPAAVGDAAPEDTFTHSEETLQALRDAWLDPDHAALGFYSTVRGGRWTAAHKGIDSHASRQCLQKC